MVEDSWHELGGTQIRYGDSTWELTGEVTVRGTGEGLGVEARQVHDVRHRKATLQFGLEDPPASLNPGDLGEHFDHLERENDEHYIVVRQSPRTYRYKLDGLEYH